MLLPSLAGNIQRPLRIPRRLLPLQVRDLLRRHALRLSSPDARRAIPMSPSDGSLAAFDASTGLPVLRRPIAADTGAPVAGISATGVAIARHTVYVEAGNYLVAYRSTSG